MSTTIQRAATRIATVLLGVLAAGAARGQYRDEQPYSDDIRQTVARVSYLTGPVSYARGDEPDDWQPADVNVPLTLGDRLYTGRSGRAELQIHGGAAIRLSTGTDLSALNLTDDTKQLSLTSGAAAFQIRRLAEDEVFEVDTPNAAITFEQAGDYRIDVDPDGNTRVGVRRGRATVAAGGGQVPLAAGDEMAIDGIDDPRYDVYGLSGSDAFDRWANDRANRYRRSVSAQYVSADVVGVADLDNYGRWEEIPEYGRVWSPTSVEVGWAPYRAGHWVWQDPWGWTWVSSEPWGWAPYHYGRWVNASSRWYWVPVSRTVRSVRYSPALVAFVGGGSGFSASIRVGGGGFVGWFPLAPRDPYVPWWGSRRADERDVRDVRYINRNYVTVVNQNTFVSGGLVTRNAITDRNVLSQVVSAPVVRGALPFVPTSASLRVAARTDLPAAPRPPATIVNRPVVARIAPPPPPPSFATKVEAIRENRGAPVSPADAARIVEQRKAPAPIAIRPVVTEPGRMTLTRGREASAKPGAPPASPGAAPPNQGAPKAAQPAAVPVPAQPLRGRPLATMERPVAAPPAAAAPARVPPPAAPPESNRPTFVTPVPRPAEPSPVLRGRPPVEAPRQVPTIAPAPPPPAPAVVAPTAPPSRGFERERPRGAPVAPPTPPQANENDRNNGRNSEDWRLRQQRDRSQPPPTPVAPGAPPPPPSRGRDVAPAQPPETGRPVAQPPAAPLRQREAAPRPTSPPPPPPPPPTERAAPPGRMREAAPPPQAVPPPVREQERRERVNDPRGPAAAPPPPAAAAPPPPPPDRGRPAPEARGEKEKKTPPPKKTPPGQEKKDERQR